MQYVQPSCRTLDTVISIFLPSTKLVEFVPLALAVADHDNLEGLPGSTHCVLQAHLRRIATHGTSSNRRETAWPFLSSVLRERPLSKSQQQTNLNSNRQDTFLRVFTKKTGNRLERRMKRKTVKVFRMKRLYMQQLPVLSFDQFNLYL